MATENENGKRLRLTKQQLCTYIKLFVHFFAIVAQPRRETSWFHVFWRTTRQGFFLKLGCSTLEFNSKKFTNIWQIERYGIKAMNFDTGWIHLLRDFFARVVLVVADKLPNVLWRKWTRANDLFFFFWTQRYSPLLEFNSSKIRQYLTNWARWNKSKEVWSSESVHFLCVVSIAIIQGHPTPIFGKYLFGRRFEIYNFRNICWKLSCLPASPRIFEHLKLVQLPIFIGFLP